MELKIPPPVVALIAAVVMWIVAWAGAAAVWIAVVPAPLPVMLFAAGVAAAIRAAMLFRAAATTVNPMKPADTVRLITHGIYSYSRNPMYLGVLLMLTSWALWLGHPANIAVLALFVWYITRFQIIPEERILERQFPGEFRAYRLRVRRWI